MHGAVTKVAIAVALLGVAAGAATAFAGGEGGGSVTRRPNVQPRINFRSLMTQRGLPADPRERARALRREILMLSINGYVRPATARQWIRAVFAANRGPRPAGLSVRALTTLPPQAHVPAEVESFLAHVGELTHSSAPDPHSVRLLRAGLGKSGADVYAFANGAGTPCFILTGYGGTCAGAANVASGVGWLVGGGHNGFPSVFVGLAADDVRRVGLTVDGAAVPATLQSNVAFADLPAKANSVVVTATRANGRSSDESISLAP